MSAGFGLSMIDRAVKESFASRCRAADLASLRDYFAGDGSLTCFYCGAPGPSRWDHLHPVSRGGDTVPGNLVPACGRCDDSKQARTVEEWVASRSPHRPPVERLAALLAGIEHYRQRFPYEPRGFDEKLSPQQREDYRRFREEIDALRTHLEQAGLLKARPAGPVALLDGTEDA